MRRSDAKPCVSCWSGATARDSRHHSLVRSDPRLRLCDILLWGSWWAILPYAVYAMLYASTSDSRWHETGHGTAFKTDWMNNVLYEIASFMVMRESTVWRWSHNRHHSDTIIVGRDPEIAVPLPPDLKAILMAFLTLAAIRSISSTCACTAWTHGRDEKTFIPATSFPRSIARRAFTRHLCRSSSVLRSIAAHFAAVVYRPRQSLRHVAAATSTG